MAGDGGPAFGVVEIVGELGALLLLPRHHLRGEEGLRLHEGAQFAEQRRILGEPLHQDVVIDPVEEFLQIHVHHDPAAFGNVLSGCLDRLMGVLPRSEAIARFGEIHLEDRRENLM